MRREGFVRQRLAACLPGRAVGALRASFGAANNESDIARTVAAVKEAAITGRYSLFAVFLTPDP